MKFGTKYKTTSVCVLFLTGIVILLTYAIWKSTFSEHMQSFGGIHKLHINKPLKIGLYKRRFVNDIGESFADEQPNLNELRAWHIKSLHHKGARKGPVIAMASFSSLIDTKETLQIKNESVPSITSQVLTEEDPKINDNIIPVSFKFFLNNNKLTYPSCTSDSPINHVVSLLTQHTGVEIINNIIYRYGDFKNEYFALPKPPTYNYYWPLRFHASYVDKTVLDRTAPSFLLNGARNNKHSIKSLVSSNAFQLVILRDPVAYFSEVFDHTGISKLMGLISDSKDVFEEFSKDPLSNIDKILNYTNKFQSKFHLLKNAQLFDLGFELNDYKTKHDLQFVIQQLDEQLDFVLIFEYLDESLVLLQRFLCWQLEDMIYLKSRLITTHNRNISEQTKKNIRLWNNEDLQLYKHFNNTLWRRVRQQQDQMFWDDVAKLKMLTQAMDEECFHQKHDNKRSNNVSRSFRSTKSSELKTKKGNDLNLFEKMDQDLSTICYRLTLSDRDYVMLLRSKQKQRLKEQYDALFNDQFLTNETSNDGKFLYALKFIEEETTYNNKSYSDWNSQSELSNDNSVESRDSSENEIDAKILTL